VNIEETVKTEALPVNSIAMCNRLVEIMRECETNCLLSLRDDYRVISVLWLLNSQVFGQLAKIDMSELWEKINQNLPESLEDQPSE